MAKAKAQEDNRWSEPVAIGAKGVALAIAEMCDHQIVPCEPKFDIGYDLVAAHNSILKRVQIKSTSIPPAGNGSFTFSVKRRKNWVVDNNNVPAISYKDNEIDVFVFVHTKLHVFFVVPAAEIDYGRYKISFLPGSPWRDAWHVLKV